MRKFSEFFRGLKDGLPICMGYLGVSFAFGIFAVKSGLGIKESLLISMTNLTSAGQFAAVPVIVGGGTLIELVLGQIIINLRYMFMSVSLSQKLDEGVSIIDRLIIAFASTDEIFAVSVSNKADVGRTYMYGLILGPYIGWSAGTFFGAAMGTVLPHIVVSALGIAIYAMFAAIVVPQMKADKKMLLCVLFAVLLSCAFYYLPILKKIPEGFVIIICSLAASGVFAFFAPVKGGKYGE
ncbi:MAG: AzlC family ABC transporter permease [Clostridia bacterium]|nr:AzlC family ABC transporter permease [Clostridia bacterium]